MRAVLPIACPAPAAVRARPPGSAGHSFLPFLRVLSRGALLLGLGGLGAVRAEPFTPQDDAQVLERTAARSTDPQARVRAELRAALRRRPGDVDTAVRLAAACLGALSAEGDPRLVGCARAALAPWWNLPDPPPEVRLQRAVALQFSHRFDEAMADLAAFVQARPEAIEGWAWQAAISMVQARYDAARQACGTLARWSSPITAVACGAQVDAATGRAGPAAAALREVLSRHPDAQREERLWALTRLAETEERLGQVERAEAAYREGLALGVEDFYHRAAYADFLLDQGRPADVTKLLEGRGRADVLLLRLAIAAQAVRDPAAAGLSRELAARFDAARRRGDALHEKEEARYVLAFAGDARRALALAADNFKLQREPADARVLLEAALAARDKAAAGPALAWMGASRIESRKLEELAAQVRALP